MLMFAVRNLVRVKIYERVFLVFFTLTLCNTVLANSFDGELVRALFTTKITNNEPLNEVLILDNDTRELFFFSEVRNMQGKILVHRWEYRGKKVFEKKFKVTKDSQKLISNYSLDPAQTGEWMVIISDERDWPIKAVIFKFVKQGSFAGNGVLPVKRK